MNTYTVLDQQSLFDIAIEVYGHVDGVIWLLQDNPDYSLTHRLRAGQQLNVRDEVLNARQKTTLQDFAPFQTIDEADRPIGVNYWYLEEYYIP